MLDPICVDVSDIDRSRAVYEAPLAPLDYRVLTFSLSRRSAAPQRDQGRWPSTFPGGE
ncbi:hypothetical protein KKHFBJBL_02612 [Brevundimonas sp. NIBR11]|nr:hypothetical protein KKHFBJBL_02612 [Brevundimonas sp. NIBR11]